MKKLLTISTLLAFLAITASSIQAQKFGHVNSGNILSLMPETTASDQALKIYQDSLIAIGQERAKALRSDFDAFMVIYNEGGVTPVKAQEKQAEFQRKEQELLAFEQEVSNMVALKRQELLEPIITRLNDVIQEVGKEGEYTMIFDVSVYNAVLFAKDTEDLTELVKSKLNIQ